MRTPLTDIYRFSCPSLIQKLLRLAGLVSALLISARVLVWISEAEMFVHAILINCRFRQPPVRTDPMISSLAIDLKGSFEALTMASASILTAD